MARTSVMVSDQQTSAAFVASALTIHREKVIAGLLANNAALLPEDWLDEAVLQQLLTWLGKLLQRKNETLATAEAAYVAEQADDVPLRTERDARYESLNSHMIRVRDRVEVDVGRDQLAAYGLSNRTPRTLQELLVYGKTAAALLRERPVMVPDGVGGVLSTEALAESIEGLCSSLEVNVQQLVTEQRELEAARVARNTAQDELVAMYQMVAGLLVYVFRLAGHPELAERVRPSNRRARTPSDGTTPPPDDGGSGDPANDDAPDAPAVTARR